jgi:hypothetical protein
VLSKTKLICKAISLMLAVMILTVCSTGDKTSSRVLMNNKVVASSSPAITSAPSINKSEQMKSVNNKKVIESFEEYEASKQPLIAAIPEKDIYLYEIKDTKEAQLMLTVGDKKCYYNWIGFTPRFILPKMSVSDFDKDGKDELSVILYVGSGTGVSIEELHILEISETAKKECFKDQVFSAEDYVSQLKKTVKFKTYTKAGKLMGTITAGGKKYTVSLKEFQSDEFGKISNDLCWWDIVGFDSKNNKLTASFGVGISCKNAPTPQYIGDLYADVSYKAGKFKLANFRFKE